MAHIVNLDELPASPTSTQFEGYLHDSVNISFFLTHPLPGSGPLLHSHPYEEVFIVQAGTLIFTAGNQVIKASSGQIVIVMAGEPHKFVNCGNEPASLVNIHVSPRMITTWLENHPD